MTNIQIDSGAVRDLVAKGIMDAIGPEQRDLVIQQAVAGLLERPKDSLYGRETGRSPLEIAFTTAVNDIARDVVAEYLAAEPQRDQVRAQILTAVEGFFRDNQWQADSIGDAIGREIAKLLRGEAR